MAQGHACSPCPLHAPSMARRWPKELLQKAPAKGLNHRPCVQNAQGFGVRWPSGLGGGGVGPCHRPPPRCNACPNPTRCFFAMFVSLHGTVVQCRRTGKALVPLFALTACKCSNRVFSTPPASGHRKPGQCRPGVRVACLASGAGTKPRCIGSSAAPRHSLYRQRQKGHRRICRYLLFHRVNPWTFAKAQNLAYSL